MEKILIWFVANPWWALGLLIIVLGILFFSFSGMLGNIRGNGLIARKEKELAAWQECSQHMQQPPAGMYNPPRLPLNQVGKSGDRQF